MIDESRRTIAKQAGRFVVRPRVIALIAIALELFLHRAQLLSLLP
jgi:hypothetical protein